MSDLRNAWAVLDLKPGSTLDALRAQYRKLVKRWHPDRFAKDPTGQAEATERLQRINTAYRNLLEAVGTRPSVEATARNQVSPPTGRPLSREEIDRMIASIGKYSEYEDVEEVTNREGRWHAAYLGVALVVTLSLMMHGVELSWWETAFLMMPIALIFLVLQILSALSRG